MNNKIIIKAIIMLLIFNVFLILANTKVQANASSDISSLDISIDSVIESAEEENIVCYDAATGKTTEVDMEELKQVLISTYGENYTSTSTSAYISSPKKTLFTSNIQPIATPYSSTNFKRVTNTKVQPYSSICRISCYKDNKLVVGTGFLVGSNKLLTAMHCVMDSSTKTAYTNWTCYPGYSNGPYNNYSAGWQRIYYDKRWMENASAEYDWCLCTLGKDLGQHVGVCYLETCDDYYLKNASITSVGYPTGLDSAKFQYYADGQITQINSLYFNRTGRLQKGMSGGPTMRTSGNHNVVGINVGVYSDGSDKTLIVRITDSIFNLVLNNS